MTTRCFIPSKGRPRSRTHRLFLAAGIDTHYVVEPQDASAYCAQGLPVLLLPENDRGLAFSRNWIVQHAQSEGVELAFMCDDDVLRFSAVINGRVTLKSEDVSTPVLRTLLDLLQKHSRAIVGLSYPQVAWSAKMPVNVNAGWVDVCIAFRPREIRAVYNAEMELKEDRDWQLQNIAHGLRLIRYNHGCFAAPSVGSNAGGLYARYLNGDDERAAVRMVQKWHPYLRLKRAYNRVDIAADWPLIRKRLYNSAYAHH